MNNTIFLSDKFTTQEVFSKEVKHPEEYSAVAHELGHAFNYFGYYSLKYRYDHENNELPPEDRILVEQYNQATDGAHYKGANMNLMSKYRGNRGQFLGKPQCEMMRKFRYVKSAEPKSDWLQ